MVPDAADRLTRRTTFLMMAVAWVSCEIAADPNGNVTATGIAVGAVEFLLGIAVSYLIPRPTAVGQKLPTRVTWILAGLLVAPLIFEPLWRGVADVGLPLEMQMICGLRVLGIALAAGAVWPVCLRLAGVVALFLALFASAMGDQPQIPWALGTFSLVGGVWLVLVYRSALTGAVAGNAVGGRVVERVRLRLPLRELSVFGLLAAFAVGIVVAGPKRVLVSFGELLPTSGGTGATDLRSRGGVGDGPEETKGKNASAAGMIDADTFIESLEDSLLDAVSDMYGEAHKPNKKDREKMIAIGPVEVQQNHGKLPENRRPSREFDISRKAPSSPRKPDSRSARALLEVEGRTPLHIRLRAFDTYDSNDTNWKSPERVIPRVLEVDEIRGGEWMAPIAKRAESVGFGIDDTHKIKVADLKDNLVPLPSQMTRFRVRKVESPEHYEVIYDGVIGFAGRTRTPPGVVVQSECRTVDPKRLPPEAFPLDRMMTSPTLTSVPDSLRPRLESLAREWTADLPVGWPQIGAVLARLRETYALDARASAPPNHPSPILWFLEESRTGPDYLFASSAVLMLRTLGYSSRLSLGYYAAEDAFDPVSRHTPVNKYDLHFWPEVSLRDGSWLAVEPTPGYSTLAVRLPWYRRLLAEVVAGMARVARHPLTTVASLSLLAFVAIRRRWLRDRANALRYRLRRERSWRDVAGNAVWLLERRTALAGLPRDPSETLPGWSRRLAQRLPPSCDLNEMVRLSEWSAYGPCPPSMTPDEIRLVCRRVLRQASLKTLTSTPAGGRR